ncbi:MAG: glycerol kinase GlpK [Firmicutes bacterium]|nr:glycerol kinase GlpK [Bacillota bacterium]
MKKYLVALDQGTTSSRAIVFDEEGAVIAQHAIEFEQIYDQPGWVEHDPMRILSTQIDALRRAVALAKINPPDIAAIGITNQRETTLLWDRKTGKPVYNAIVWQCRRTAPIVEELRARGLEAYIRQTTGLVPDAYFSGTKLNWLLKLPGVRQRAEAGELCFGTVDTWLAWNLIEGRPHITDVTNASRTMLMDVRTLAWDEAMLNALEIPVAVLPEIVDSVRVMGMLDPAILGCRVPVGALAGDQHAALFGQACLARGDVKNTYGTGCFLLMNTGDAPVFSKHGLVTTVAWRINGKTTYALEGSVFVAGAAVQWLRDEMRLIERASDSEAIARSVSDNGGVYFVPAFAGLGAPHWDMYGRGTIVGLTRGTGRAHIVRAALEAVAYQSVDMVAAMAADCGYWPGRLRADGGTCANGFLMQFQADMLNRPVERPKVIETTALGTAMMAGLAVGALCDVEDMYTIWKPDLTFSPKMEERERAACLRGWSRALERAKRWVEA